jgi:hypothetical protein
MNFLRRPEPCSIHPNTVMDEEQVLVAAAFVDELLDLAVVGRQPPGGNNSILSSAPLFVVVCLSAAPS